MSIWKRIWLTIKRIDTPSKVLPSLLAILTRKPRYLPDIQWSSNSWVHNIFRVYELIFWREAEFTSTGKVVAKIRAEGASWPIVDEQGNKVGKGFACFTFENFCAQIETAIRNFFEIKWLDIRLTNLQFAFPANTPQLQIPWISFAIALDVSNTGASTLTSPLTWSHTTTGSNPLIAICPTVVGTGTTPTIGTVSYNSVAATSAVSNGTNNGGFPAVRTGILFLGSCATGAKTVSVAFSGTSPGCAAGAISYSGAQSGSTADATNSTVGTTTGAKSISVTTIADNCWVVGSGGINDDAATPTLTSQTQTSRWNIAATDNFSDHGKSAGQDTNTAKTPAGAVSIGWTVGGTDLAYAICGASFAPGVAAATVGEMMAAINLPTNQPMFEQIGVVPY
jgi:hypothetical protein